MSIVSSETAIHFEIEITKEEPFDFESSSKFIINNAYLEELTIDGNMTLIEFKMMIDVLANKNTLLRLNLYDISMGSLGLNILSNFLKSNDKLEKLTIADPLGCDGAEIIANGLLHASSNSRLKILELEETEIGSRGAQALAKVLDDSCLEKLSLWSNEIGEEGAIYLAQAIARNPKLQVLNLGSNKIGSRGGQELANSLTSNSNLIELVLYNNQFDYDAAVSFGHNLLKNNSLRKLDLSGQDLTPPGEEELYRLCNKNLSLEKLYVSMWTRIYYKQGAINKSNRLNKI